MSAANDAIEAQVFRHLVAHLRQRIDVQNIDLMISGGFCRNCLADWLAEASGGSIDKDAAREAIYGMPYADYKARHQAAASDEQLAAMAASVALNKA